MVPRSQVHFAHANGFPAGSYKKITDGLSTTIHTFAKPIFGHDIGLQDDDNWQSLVDELIHYCEINKTPNIPLWAVGHSMGAIVSFKACCQRPDLFSGLVMLDPPLLTGAVAQLYKWLKKTAYIDKVTPAGMSKLRKSQWCLLDNTVDYFSAKRLFQDIPRECIEDYVNAGLYQTGEHQKLRFNPRIETQLFRHIPVDLNNYKHKLLCSGHIVVGSVSKVCNPFMYKGFAKHHNLNTHVIEGGHMFPLEKPKETSELLKRVMSNGT